MKPKVFDLSNSIVKSNNRACCIVLFAVFGIISQPVSSDNNSQIITKTILSLLNTKQHPLLQQADFSNYSKELTELYRINSRQLIWLGEGRSEKNILDALDVLNNADTDGLNPVNYDAERLKQYFQSASLRQADYTVLASYDLALSISMLRYLHDVNVGRIDPRNFNYPTKFGSKQVIDTVLLLKHHLEQQKITELPTAAAPKIKQYHLLKQAMLNFRQQDGFLPRNKLILAKSLHPGEMDPQMPELRQRLLEMGELKQEDLSDVDFADQVYDESTVNAVKHLQQNQGLQADGLIGKQTMVLLNQTPAEKISLISLAMERLRWLPEQISGPLILVNIPAFELWAYDSIDDANALNMKVVVGKSPDNQTPLLFEEMRYLEFMPYWNIPRSILDKEILPKMQAGRNYLAKQDIELVESYAGDDLDDPQNVMGNIKHGLLRARQMPGNKNPLGKVKFIFPNKDDVYLHDTPFHGVFGRDRRDLSHGCVRVAEAAKLAEFVLSKQIGWDKKTIEAAMTQGSKTQRVSLKKAIPVLFFYNTAFAGLDNKLRFYPDIYGYDQLLQSALNKSDNKIMIGKNATIDG